MHTGVDRRVPLIQYITPPSNHTEIALFQKTLHDWNAGLDYTALLKILFSNFSFKIKASIYISLETFSCWLHAPFQMNTEIYNY